MSPRPWAEWPGRHHWGSSGVLPAPPAVALAEKSWRADGRPEVGSPSSCETWSGWGPPTPLALHMQMAEMSPVSAQWQEGERVIARHRNPR